MSDKTGFVPPAKALAVVGLSPADIGDVDGVYALIDAKDAEIRRSDAQISVLVYIQFMRGQEVTALVKRTGYVQSSVYRKVAEGMAIVRTGNVDRAVSAVRTGNLSQDKVDELTRGTRSSDAKLEALEAAALGQYIRSSFVQESDGAAPEVHNLPALVQELAAAATNDSVPVVMSELVQYMPQVNERLGLKKKTTPRTPEVSGPFGLEYHFNQALADVKQLQKDSDGEPYVPTEADLAALMALCTYVGVDLSAPMFAASA